MSDVSWAIWRDSFQSCKKPPHTQANPSFTWTSAQDVRVKRMDQSSELVGTVEPNSEGCFPNLTLIPNHVSRKVTLDFISRRGARSCHVAWGIQPSTGTSSGEV